MNLSQAIAGLASGGGYALIAVGLVLSYRVGSVLNFSQGFVGMISVYTMAVLIGHGMPTWPAIVIAIVMGAVISAVQGAIMALWFADKDVMVRSAVTIGMGITFFAIATVAFGKAPRFFPRLFSGLSWSMGGTTVDGLSFVSFLLAIVVSFALWLGLTRTRFGVILRAVASKPSAADLLGIRTQLVVVGVWGLAGLLSTAAAVLIAPTRGGIDAMSLVIIPALAAALMGGLRSYGLTVVGGLVLGVLGSLSFGVQTLSPYADTVPFIVLTLVLLWAQRKNRWGDAR